MDIEPPIKPATDSDDNKSNDSTASQPQHLQEMAKSTVVLKEAPAPVAANDNANAEAPIPVTLVAPLPLPTPPEAPIVVSLPEPKPVETALVTVPTPQVLGMHSAPPAATQIPLTPSVPGPIPHSQEASIPPPNVTVAHHQGMGIVGAPIPPHAAYPGYPQGPPRAPFYGHMPPYQQGFQQYPYGHHMPPYQQNYHGPPHMGPAPHGYPVPGHPPGAENHNPYQQGPAMHPGPIPHQPLPPTIPPASVVAPPPTAATPPAPEEPAEKNGS